MPGSWLLLLGVVAGQTASTAGSKVELRCGAYCLYAALKALDLPVASYEVVEKTLGEPTELGYSLAQLQRTGESLGAHVLGVQASLDALASRQGRFACIALLEKRSHYVLIYDIDEKNVYVIDPPRKYAASRDAFAALWPGKALLLSDVPIQAASPPRLAAWVWAVLLALLVALAAGGWVWRGRRQRPSMTMKRLGLVLVACLLLLPACTRTVGSSVPRIHVAPTALDLGTLDGSPEPKSDAMFTVSNRGGATLRLLGLGASCGCTIVEWPVSEIAPGQGVPVRLRVHPKNTAGPHTSMVTIRSDDPATPVVKIALKWIETLPVAFDPPSLDLGWVEPGHAVSRAVQLALSRTAAGPDLELESSHPDLSGAFVNPAASADDSGRGEARRSILVHLRPESAQGPQAAALWLRRGDELLSELPVSWKAGPRVEVTPSYLCRSKVRPGTTIPITLRVASAKQQPIVVKAIRVDGDERRFHSRPGDRHEAGELVVSLDITAGSSPGVEEHTTQVILQDQESHPLRIPAVLFKE